MKGRVIRIAGIVSWCPRCEEVKKYTRIVWQRRYCVECDALLSVNEEEKTRRLALLATWVEEER